MAVLASLRLANQATLLEQLLGRKAASRAELAKATGMSKPTVGRIIDNLVMRRRRRGAAHERRRPPRPGPPRQAAAAGDDAHPLRRDRAGRRADAHLGAAPSPPDQEHWDVQFKTPTTADAWQERVVHSAESLDVKRPWAVLVSTPGVVDERAGRVLLSPNLHWTEQADLPRMLRQIGRRRSASSGSRCASRCRRTSPCSRCRSDRWWSSWSSPSCSACSPRSSLLFRASRMKVLDAIATE